MYTLAGFALHTNAELNKKIDTVCSNHHMFVEDEKEALDSRHKNRGSNEGQNAYIRSEMAEIGGALLLIQAKALPDFDNFD